MGLPERKEVHNWSDQELLEARDIILDEVARRGEDPGLITDEDMAELDRIEAARKQDPTRGIPLEDFLREWNQS